MKSYLEFEREVKDLEEELGKLKDPFNKEGITEVNTTRISEIQREIAFLGGHSNAFTSHESVAYYISVPFENLEKCIEILSDMVFNPIFPEEEILREIEVVKEEEASALDDVGSFIWKGFSENF